MKIKSRWRIFIARMIAADLKDYRYEVNHENMTGMLVYLVMGEMIAVVGLLFQLFNHSRSIFDYAHYIEMTLFYGILLCCYILYKEEWSKNATGWLYGLEISGLLLLLFQSMAFDTETESFIIPLCLIVLPMFVIDVPWRLFLLIISSAAVFLCLDYSAKSDEIFMRDLMHILWCVPISCVLCYRNIYARMLGKIEKHRATQTAEHDILTGILNRRGGEQLVKECLAYGESGSCIILDVDNFKHVNDNYGHARGDEILILVADALKHCFRDSDIVFRMGGDEFVVYAPTMVDVNSVKFKLSEIQAEMRKILLDEKKGIHITVSMGCAINLGSYPTYEALYETADHFLYETKRRSKDGYSITNADYKPDRVKK